MVYWKDLTGFVEQFMNRAASDPVMRRSSPELQIRKAFKDRDRTAEKKDIISKDCIVSGKVTLLGGLEGTRKFQVGWLRITFPGKVAAVIKLGIKFRFPDMGL